LSALWIGVVVYLIEPKTYTRFWKAVYEVKSSDGRVRQFNLAGSQTELAADITAWMQAQRPDINISEFEKDLDELVTAMKSEYQAELNEAKTAWMLAVLPPFALLGFGLCIFWIVRGFRPRTQPLN
jgi:SH3-like domain-containing protein